MKIFLHYFLLLFIIINMYTGSDQCMWRGAGCLIMSNLVRWKWTESVATLGSVENILLIDLLCSGFSECWFLCCGSGSKVQIVSVFRNYVDPDPYSEYGAESTQVKWINSLDPDPSPNWAGSRLNSMYRCRYLDQSCGPVSVFRIWIRIQPILFVRILKLFFL